MNFLPHRLRLSPAGVSQHIVQRGNNRQVCFACDEDVAAYANWLHEGARKYEVLIHAWVFMTNHVYLLMTPQVDLASSSEIVMSLVHIQYQEIPAEETSIRSFSVVSPDFSNSGM
tara:strand:- start:1982 stop:2326 length:345 start_codon:yes stop_codon:yes gene_type:complete